MTTTSSTNSANGPGRRTLATQIDRLDSLLDGLAEGLNQAVAGCVQETVGIAVREAVQAVLCELLTNPDLLARFQGFLPSPVPPQVAQPAPAPAPTSWLGSIGQGIARTCGAVGRGVQGVLCCAGKLCGSLWQGTCSGARVVFRSCQPLAFFRNQLLISLGVGVTAGVVAYCSAPWLAALASGVGAFALAAALQVGLWLRKAMDGLAAVWD